MLATQHRFRLALCGHKAVEAGAVCLVIMVGGSAGGLTLAHLAVATQTGVLAVLPAVALTYTRHVHHLANRWTASTFFAVCTFAADAIVHASHYPGVYTEATLTAIAAFFLSLTISYTPLGKRIDRLAEALIEGQRPHPAGPGETEQTAGGPD